MAAASGGIDPRYPEAFQRGGSPNAPVVDDPAVVHGAVGRGAVGRGAAPTGSAPPADATSPAVSADAAPGGSERIQPVVEATDPPHAELADVRYAELVVAGNPWLRALWAVGTLTVVAGFALTVIAQYAFSVPPASGIYDPSAYILPSIAQAVAQPLVTAGVIALVAATALRIVAWRPSAARTILRD